MTREEIIQRLNEIATFLELAEASPFEVLAFRNAAESLYYWDVDLEKSAAEGTLTEIDSVGKGIATVIAQFVQEGRSDKYDTVRGDYPLSVLELFKLPGLGMKKIKLLYNELGIADLESLEQAVAAGSVRQLSGFGAKSEERIQRSIDWLRENG